MVSVTASLFLAEASFPTGDLAAAVVVMLVMLVMLVIDVEIGDLVREEREVLEEECLILPLGGCGLLAAASLSSSSNSFAKPSSFLPMTIS